MAGRTRQDVDLTGIRQRGGKYQVRIFGGTDPVTGKQVMLTGSADLTASGEPGLAAWIVEKFRGMDRLRRPSGERAEPRRDAR